MTDQAKNRRPAEKHPAFSEDPDVIVHPGEAPYEVRLEIQIMQRDWNALTNIQVGSSMTMHRVVQEVLRRGLAEVDSALVRRGGYWEGQIGYPRPWGT